MRPADALPQRLVEIGDRLDEILCLHRPAVASVEQLFFSKDPQAAAKLGHARGVILATLARQNVVIREHAPARIKRTLTGSGQADKGQVARVVCAVLGLEEGLPPDASDALAMAITELRLDPRSAQEDQMRKKPRQTKGKLPPHVLALVRKAQESRGRPPAPSVLEE